MKLANIILSMAQILLIRNMGLIDIVPTNTLSCEFNSFVKDEVLVVLLCENNEENKEFNTSDFSEINCRTVRNICTITPKNRNEKVKKIFNIKLKNSGKNSVLSAIRTLKQKNNVIIAEPNYTCLEFDSASSNIPNDPLISLENNWAFDKINLQEAWEIETGDDSVRVAVIDSGITYLHPDLSYNVLRNFADILDFAPIKNSTLIDEDGHGTFVAGIIGAVGNNNYGTSGVCWDVSLIPAKLTNDSAEVSPETISDAIMAINSLIDDNIDIPLINLSMGGYVYSETLELSIENYPGLVICSAGNDYKDLDTYPHYPSSLGLNNVITVGASTNYDTIWAYNDSSRAQPGLGGSPNKGSNYSENVVDLFAPGVNILSTYPIELCSENCSQINASYHQYGYHVNHGTSFATPFVTGVAALLKSHMPELTSQQIKNIILKTTDSISSLQNYCKTGGRLNAYAALNSHRTGHSYDDYYSWKNKTTHIAHCICGVIKTTPHVVVSGSNICIECGGQATGGFVGMLSSNDYIASNGNLISSLDDINYVTVNGSYYLSNGILVLNKNDIESYLNNTIIYL